MFHNIIDPITNKEYSIFSDKGKILLKFYVSLTNGGKLPNDLQSIKQYIKKNLINSRKKKLTNEELKFIDNLINKCISK